MTKRILSFLLSLSLCAAAAASVKKIACVGDSITYGHGIADREMTYPKQLGRLLGEGFEVGNFGVSGSTLLANGNAPYIKTKKYLQSLAFGPDIVVIKLGTNDSKAANFARISEFERDLNALVESFEKLPSRPKVFLCLPAPAFSDGTSPLSINGGRIVKEIDPAIRRVAAARGLVLIDLYSPLKDKPEFFPDRIHPNALGAAVIAAAVSDAVKRP